jgi:hypothetical protein
MSLTSFLDLKDVKAKFRETFPKPSLSPLGEMRAAPLTKNYSLVGTAFDYLLRFYLEHHYWFTQTYGWIAQMASFSPLVEQEPILAEQVDGIIREAQEQHKAYLRHGQITEGLIRSCLFLAQLDPIYRRRVIVPDLGRVDGQDIIDLNNLLSLVTPDTLKSEKICLLDPTFGASSLVGGADVDLVIDDMIIDIKTTIDPTLRRKHFNQIVGYYMLYRLAGINGAPINHQINRLAIYSSRFASLQIFPVSEIATEADFEAFSQWFVARAEQQFGRNSGQLRRMRRAPISLQPKA